MENENHYQDMAYQVRKEMREANNFKSRMKVANIKMARNYENLERQALLAGMEKPRASSNENLARAPAAGVDKRRAPIPEPMVTAEAIASQ